MKITPIIRPARIRRDGLLPILIRITKGDYTVYKKLPVDIRPSDWDWENNRVRRTKSNHNVINRLILHHLEEMEKLSIDLELERRELSAANFLSRYNGEDSHSLHTWMEKLIDNLYEEGKVSEYKNWSATLKKLVAFRDDIPLSNVDVVFLNEFQSYCRVRLKNVQNTINKNLGIIRRAISIAVERNIISAEKNPFLHFSMPKAQVIRKRMKASHIHNIVNLEYKENSALFHAKNYFLFSFYSRGMRFSDVCTLKWEEVHDDYIIYDMDKVGRITEVRIIKPLADILSLYKNIQANSSRVFPLLADEYDNVFDEKQRISTMNAYINKNLKRIGKDAGIPFHFSFHAAKHAFLDIGDEMGIAPRVLQQLGNHTNFKMTEKYITRQKQNQVDEAHLLYEKLVTSSLK